MRNFIENVLFLVLLVLGVICVALGVLVLWNATWESAC